MSELGQPPAREQFSPAEALEHASSTEDRARRRARWPAWFWLVLAATMPAHLIGTQVGNGTWVETAVAGLPLAVGIGGLAYCAVQRAESRVLRRLVGPVTASFVALVILDVVLRWTVLDDGPTVALVVFGLLPAAPCLYGTWRVLHG